ncbi:response regulator [Paenibacillus lycopersici]|uniref:Response regulator n=1 Tax=Paenibacillus lycopersici TaxID=2704462 RepID=A0A6C0FU94_9BACL|nr:helix-turn-helix domain-containing protein [Paenibacillus lycopersici]QHT58943.1 response regulator [Paenibacillus lycopersici]
MHRLLLVDDEPSIVDGLMQHFQETQPELDICKAYSADEALDIAKRTKIDLLISDISMPGKNGLQLIDEIGLYWPGCRMILLTGHSEFEYVHTAIRRNVDNYILKTEGIEPVSAAVNAAIVKLEEENGARALLARAQQQMTAAEPLLKKAFFEALLLGEQAADIAGEWHFAGLELRLDRGRPVLMVIGRADAWDEQLSYTKKMDVLYSIQNLFAHRLSALLREERVVFHHSELVWFIQPEKAAAAFADAAGGTDWRGVITYMKGILETVQNDCRDMFGLSVSFGIGGSASEWTDIGGQYEQLKTAMKQLAYYGQQMAILDLGISDVYKPETARPAAASATDFNKSVAALQKHLQAGDEQAAAETTAELFGCLRSHMAGHYMLGLERYYALLHTVAAHMNDTDYPDKADSGLLLASLPGAELPAEWEDAQRRFAQLAASICLRRRERVERGENLLCERIHRFIHDNLGGDLSLARIAESVFLNPSYLSRCYKQLTGRNLSDYINTAKSEAAVGMLVQSPAKIGEIALRLGFESPSYFTAFFRKMTGMSPQEYRDAYGLESRK